MKVLVSGGTGLVGRYLVEGLLAAGYQVTVGGREAPAPGLFSAPVSFSPLALDPDLDQSHLFDDAYYFVHAAFDHIAGRYRGGEGDDPSGFRRRNLDGTIRLFESAKRAGVRRCVFLSSRAVYDGLPPGTGLNEDAAGEPTSLYGQVKLTAERVLAELSATDFATASLRATGIYGDLRPNKWDGLFADYLAGRPVPSRAGCEVHGRDVAGALRLLLDAEAIKINGRAFNLSDVLTDTREILSVVKAETGCPYPLPDGADKSAVSTMLTDRILALGWAPGGRLLMEESILKLVRRN